MKVLLLAILVLTGTTVDSRSGDLFYSPEALFPQLGLPVLSAFEKAKVETTWRGFILRGDTFPAYKQSETIPSNSGVYLNVAVRDPAEIKKFEDSTTTSKGLKTREIDFPAWRGVSGEAMLIEFTYGPTADARVVRTINQAIDGVIKSYRSGA